MLRSSSRTQLAQLGRVLQRMHLNQRRGASSSQTAVVQLSTGRRPTVDYLTYSAAPMAGVRANVPVRRCYSSEAEPPWVYFVHGVLLGTGMCALACRFYVDTTGQNSTQLPIELQQHFVAIWGAETHAEKRQTTFDCARTLIRYCALEGDTKFEHGALAESIELADGRAIEAADTCLFEIEKSDSDDTRALVFAVNADQLDKDVWSAVWDRVEQEIIARLGSGKRGLLAVMVRNHVVFGEWPCVQHELPPVLSRWF